MPSNHECTASQGGDEDNAHQWQKCDRLCQDAALLNKYSDDAALTDEEKKRVPRLQKNSQQRKRRHNDSALLNKYYEDDLPVMDEEEKRVRRLLGWQLLSNYLVIPVVTVFCSQILVTLLTFDTVTGKISESKWKVTSK